MGRSEGSPQVSSDAPPPAYRLYTPGQVTLATFLGAPVAGSVLLASNARRLRSRSSPGLTVAFGVAGTLLLFALAYLLPDNVPSTVLPIGYTVAMYQVARQLQGFRVDSHLAAGGRKRSWWAAAGIGLAFMILVLLIAFAIALLLPDDASVLN